MQARWRCRRFEYRAEHQAVRRVGVAGDLEVVDMDMDRMLIVVVVENVHSSIELRRGWISGTLGKAPPSKA